MTLIAQDVIDTLQTREELADAGRARAHTFRPVLKQFVPTHTINLTELAEGKSA